MRFGCLLIEDLQADPYDCGLKDRLMLQFFQIFPHIFGEYLVERTSFLILLSMRPSQWIKNILVFVALIFSKNVFNIPMLTATIGAFIVFCFVSSGIYILNDLLDIEKDKKHPVKGRRPLASGELSPLLAKVIVLTTLSGSLVASYFVNLPFAITVLGYIFLQIGYFKFAKEIVILDVFFIAAGFFLRVIAGAKVIEVPISSWLLICTIFVSLFLGLGKRRHEILLLGVEAVSHRKVLAEYKMALLDQMVGIVTAGTVISYSLYTLSPETVKKFGTENLWLTIPFVLYGIFRYLYLIYTKEKGGNPELIFLEDRHILLSIIGYLVVVGIVVYL